MNINIGATRTMRMRGANGDIPRALARCEKGDTTAGDLERKLRGNAFANPARRTKEVLWLAA